MRHSENLFLDVSCKVLSSIVSATMSHARSHPGKIYFLARDGWLPWNVLNGSIDGEYVYLSRLVLRQVLMSSDPARAARWLLDPVSINTPTSVLSKIDATPYELADTLVKGGFKESSWHTPMGATARSVFSRLFQTNAFKQALESLRERKMPNLEGYLSQVGILRDPMCHIVDIGWNGSCHAHLQEIRSWYGLGKQTMGGVYLGLQKSYTFDPNVPITCVWKEAELKAPLFKHRSFYSIAEMMLTASHGGTIGYVRSNDEYKPLFSDIDTYSEHYKELSQLQQIMIHHANHVMMHSRDVDTNELAYDFLDLLKNPDPKVCQQYGHWPVTFDLKHKESQKLIQSLSVKQIVALPFRGNYTKILWPEGVANSMVPSHAFLFKFVLYFVDLMRKVKSILP